MKERVTNRYLSREAVLEARAEPARTCADMTVVVTCHNYAAYLRQCLESILAQTIPARRVILIDDASDDHTPAVATAYADRVEYIRVEYRNVSEARMHGLSEARTQWVLFVDADNWISENYLESLIATAAATRAAIVYPTLHRFGTRESIHIAAMHPPHHIARWNFIDTCSLMRAEAIRAAGGWRGAIDDPYEDWGLAIRLLAAGWKAAPCPDAVLHYRMHGDNRSSSGRSPRETIEQNAAFTLLTVFSGRTWNLDRYFKWLLSFDCRPEQWEIYAIDNSCDPAFSKQLKRRLARQRRFGRIRLERVETRCDPDGALSNAQYAGGDWQTRTARDGAIHTHLASLYRQAFARATGDFLFVVEDDILPPADAATVLLEPFAHGDHFTAMPEGPQTLAAMGAVVTARQFGQVMACDFTWRAGEPSLPLLQRQPHPEQALTRVEHVCAACTLYWLPALRKSVQPRYEDTGEHRLYWDVSVSLDLRRAGYSLGLASFCRAWHYEENGSYV